MLQTGTADFVIKIYRAGQNPEYPEGGKMTQYLESLHVGDNVSMIGPGGKLNYFGNGKFTVSKKPSLGNITRKSLGFIAGGTGIAPCYHVV